MAIRRLLRSAGKLYHSQRGTGLRRSLQFVPGAPANGLLTNLLAYWTLNESSGNRLDSSGNGKTMVQTGSVTGAAGFGNVGAVSVWNGNAANYLSLGSALFTSGDWSVGGWFNVTSATSSRWLFSQGVLGSANSQYVVVNTSRRLVLSPNQGNTSGTGATVLTNGTWHFLLVTYAAGVCNLYLDGSSSPEVTVSASADYTGVNSFYLGIGAPISFPMNGPLVGWGAWSAVLTASQISALFNNNDGLAFSSFN